MNQNYIAAEALDDNIQPVCPHCKKKFATADEKIKYYQGECPHCGINPCALSITNSKLELEKQPDQEGRLGSITRRFEYHPIFTIDGR